MSRAATDSPGNPLDAKFGAVILDEVRAVARERSRRLSLDTRIRDLGLDSLEILDVIARVEHACGIRIPDVDAWQIETCRDLAGMATRLATTRPVFGVELPPECWKIEESRECQQFQKSLADAATAGEADPFLAVADGISLSLIHI